MMNKEQIDKTVEKRFKKKSSLNLSPHSRSTGVNGSGVTDRFAAADGTAAAAAHRILVTTGRVRIGTVPGPMARPSAFVTDVLPVLRAVARYVAGSAARMTG